MSICISHEDTELVGKGLLRNGWQILTVMFMNMP